MRIRHFIFILISIVLFTACKNDQPSAVFDIQGHRGCRGLYPENSIPAMIHAAELGVNTLELDVVITKDKKVVLSHEPFLNHIICPRLNDSIEINEDNEAEFNIYQMSYEELKTIDCGSNIHPWFPEQLKMVSYKPLLSEVFDTVKSYCFLNSIPEPNYNIEIKSRPEWDEKYHPGIAEYADLLVTLIEEKDMTNKVSIQSFDSRAIKYVHAKYPGLTLVFLSENAQNFQIELEMLGFLPDVYSPYFKTLNINGDGKQKVKELHDMGIKVVPWTVNEIEDINAVKSYGVDGIISDYPDRVLSLDRINS